MDHLLLISVLAAGALAAAALVYLVAGRRGGNRTAPLPAGQGSDSAGRPDDGRPLHWTAEGKYLIGLVGEHKYQSAIADNVRELHGVRGSNVDCTAELVVETHNRQDPGAVSVRIKNRTVGYLKTEEASLFRWRLVQHGRSGQTTTCAARIVGGGVSRNGERSPYSVRLDLRPFD